MTMSTKNTSRRRYSEFKYDLDLDAFYEAINFSVMYSDGPNDIGQCVFPQNHKNGDTTGKFAIHREKLVYNCFVCGGGSLLSLVMELYNLNVEGATSWLRQFAQGDTRDDLEFQNYLLAMLEDVEQRVESIPYFNARVLDQFDGPTDYFLDRGISQEVIDEMNLRYSNDVLKAAPVKQRGDERVKIDKDYYGAAAIFPHYWNDSLVGWQHRWMEYGDKDFPQWIAKYTNTTDFPKSDTVYNYDYCLRSREPVHICESVPTVLVLRSIGIPAVSYFGDVPKEAQLRLMRRFAQGVVLCPDNDTNGDKLLRVATEYLEPFISVWHAEKVMLKDGADLADYMKREGGYDLIIDHLTQRVHPSLHV
jgi:DNA primase